MPTDIQSPLSEVVIRQINSLGGPELPVGLSTAEMSVLLENIAASHARISGCRIATAMVMGRS